MFKKILLVFVVLFLAVACSSTNEPNNSGNNNTNDNNTGNDNASSSLTTINVYTRDESSGTREAFEDAIELEQLTIESVETSGNGDMATKVGADEAAIGYVSLTTDFEANNLKPLSYEGVEPTVANTLSEDYSLSRPFSMTTRASGDFADDDTEAVVAAFVDFVLNSQEGLLAVESAGGIVDVDAGTAWADLATEHPVLEGDVSGITIRTSGSTSVEKALQAALQAFQAETGVEFAMAHTGSGDGYKRVLGEEKDGANAADLGFASRGFKVDDDEPQAELDKALVAEPFALDAVVAVVHADNPVTNLTATQLASIFSGEVTEWPEVE